MVEYKCPKCGYKLLIGIEISMGGLPKHTCPKCKVEMLELKAEDDYMCSALFRHITKGEVMDEKTYRRIMFYGMNKDEPITQGFIKASISARNKHVDDRVFILCDRCGEYKTFKDGMATGMDNPMTYSLLCKECFEKLEEKK